MSSDQGLFGGQDRPDAASAWALYEESERFNSAIDLYDTVRVNENFYIGKQWEGVKSNGLPTPQFNFLKRVVGFIVATITTDAVKVTAAPLAATPATGELLEPARIVNEEFEAITERNNIPALLREYARNAAVDGDGCLYTWWDPDMETGQEAKGGVRTEVIENTRVRFGNPNDRHVQSQPWIIITRQSIVREAKRRARENGMADWDAIRPDGEEQAMDAAKRTGDKVTELLLLWRDQDSGEIWAFETTRTCPLRDPYSTGIRLYPVCWLNWDYVPDCYHGQAMITGLIPNQIFVNKIWAAVMLSNQRGAFPKVIFDKTRIKNWDNRVGAAIGINGGDVNTVARNMDGAVVSPQIPRILELAVEMTEKCLGATSVALGDTKPDNTSAIIALQRAAATPSEMTKQNLYQSVEELYRIYLEFMGSFYGRRPVDMETPEQLRPVFDFAGQEMPEEICMDFDFSLLRQHPMALKLDVGASSYYSEIAAMQTLDNLLKGGHITALQYLERIPDGYVPARRALINEMKAAQENGAQNASPERGGAPAGGGGV
ncbi:MAG: hypothetical protein SPE18_08980 [Candidatus Limivicinus sp.]|nr:hypothetical protein [Candidatus Limivicinus sp.]